MKECERCIKRANRRSNSSLLFRCSQFPDTAEMSLIARRHALCGIS